VCPPCFNFSDEDEDRTIQIAIDRIMQHARLERQTLWEIEIFEPKLFFDYGRKKFDLARSANEQVNTIIPSNTSWHKFKATDRWNSLNTITTIQKALDESGVFGNAGFHGVNWRFLNIYGGGKCRAMV
jgi:hypothetical protein